MATDYIINHGERNHKHLSGNVQWEVLRLTDIEQKKEYLKGYEKAVRKAERSEIKIKELRLNKIFPSALNDGMPHAKNQSDLSGYAALLDEEERHYQECRYQQLERCKEIIARIEQLSDENEKDVLIHRYIELMKWEDIAVRMGFSYKWVHKIHNKALNHLII